MRLGKERVELGKKYRDSITGFEGVATAKTDFLYGCVRVLLEGVTSEEKNPEEFWFDEQRLKDVETEAPVQPTATSGGQRGGAPRSGLRG